MSPRSYAAQCRKIEETPGWLRRAVRSLRDIDPIDALADAERLVEVQRARVREMQNGQVRG